MGTPCGTYIVVDADTKNPLLQRVLNWAQLDRDKIVYHQGYTTSYVFIPSEVAAAGHGDLILRDGAEAVTLGTDQPVWINPTIFDVDGINPNTGIEYAQAVENFGPRGDVGSTRVTIGWDYSGTLEQRTEPTGWLLRYRAAPQEGVCPPEWRTRRLPGWQRQERLGGLSPKTEYQVTLQGIAQPGSTQVLSEAILPVTFTTTAAGGDGGDGEGDGDGDGGTGDQPPQASAAADPADPTGRTVILTINNTGDGSGDGGSGDGGDTQAALKAHIAEYHTTKQITDGVTAADGWSVDAQQLTATPDALIAVVTVQRTGADVATKPAPEAGNLVPDLLVATVDEAWRPSGPDPVICIGATGFGHGSLRVTPAGEVFLLDWSNENPLKTGQNLRFSYVLPGTGKSVSGGNGGDGTGEGDGGDGGSGGGGLTREDIQKIIQDWADLYPSAYGDSFDNVETKSTTWVALEPPVSVTFTVPPSRRLVATTCMTARNMQTLAQTYQSLRITTANGSVLVDASDSRAVTVSSDNIDEASSACYTYRLDLASLGGGAVQPGEEITVTVMNRTETGTATVLDRNVTLDSAIG